MDRDDDHAPPNRPAKRARLSKSARRRTAETQPRDAEGIPPSRTAPSGVALTANYQLPTIPASPLDNDTHHTNAASNLLDERLTRLVARLASHGDNGYTALVRSRIGPAFQALFQRWVWFDDTVRLTSAAIEAFAARTVGPGATELNKYRRAARCQPDHCWKALCGRVRKYLGQLENAFNTMAVTDHGVAAFGERVAFLTAEFRRALDLVVDAHVDIIGNSVETVLGLVKKRAPPGDYDTMTASVRDLMRYA
ncbi:hypothetical protein Q8F55_008547 [Vanrija albida]|uniref:Uncharacterized protein n=1 Tax=Vanrija albida TaxID=181172 RepID=A0ABR3PR46_9TREE